MSVIDFRGAFEKLCLGNRAVGLYTDRFFRVLQAHESCQNAHGISEFLLPVFFAAGAEITADLNPAICLLCSQQAASGTGNSDEFFSFFSGSHSHFLFYHMFFRHFEL